MDERRCGTEAQRRSAFWSQGQSRWSHISPRSRTTSASPPPSLTMTTLYAVGALRALVTKLGWVRSGLEMLFVGPAAAAVAYRDRRTGIGTHGDVRQEAPMGGLTAMGARSSRAASCSFPGGRRPRAGQRARAWAERRGRGGAPSHGRAESASRLRSDRRTSRSRSGSSRILSWLSFSGAALVSAAIGEQLEAAAIAAIVVLNAVLGFVQEAGAERAVLALRDTVQRTAAVVRDGQEAVVPVEDVVPGDLVVLREGDRVPADARLVAAERLELDESALTGESVPVIKGTKAVAAGTPLAERASMTFAGTAVTRGRGRGLVVATGADSEVGQVASLTAAAKPPPTPLQRRLGRLSGAMAGIGIAITLLLGAGMLARDASLEEAFLVGVAVAVAAVPEGLAATVTITLAQGARAMAASGAIVRRLAAVETIGAATVIAADKTGTLTVNQLRVAGVRPCHGTGRDHGARGRSSRLDRRAPRGRHGASRRRRSRRRRVPPRRSGNGGG